MRFSLLLSLLLLSRVAFAAQAVAEPPKPKAPPVAAVPRGPERWEKEIAAFEAQDRAIPPKKDSL